jgi:hypothetical protein
VQLVLVKLDLRGGFDLDRPAALGSAAEVQAQLREALSPDATLRFNDRGEGVQTAAGHSIRYSVHGTDAVVEVGVEVSGRRPDAFRRLEALCTTTGWTLFDRASGRFPDLSLEDPTRPREAVAPMFLWWTALPGWVRVAVGLIIGWVLLYSLIAQWVASW